MGDEYREAEGNPDPRKLAGLAYQAAMGLVRNREDALDVAQGALTALELWKVSGRSLPCDSEAWVTKVAQDIARDLLRSRARERDLHNRMALQTEGESVPDFVDQSVARVLIHLVLKELPPQQHRALVRRYLEGRDRASVAEMMGVSEETVKTHTKRALERLRKRLEPDDDPGDQGGKNQGGER